MIPTDTSSNASKIAGSLPFALTLFSLILLVNLVSSTALAQDSLQTKSTEPKKVSYNRDIRPLLSSRCFACHGPDSQSREAGLRLDRAGGEEGSHESAIEPGDFESSELWDRLTTDDPDTLMPPPDSHLKPFTKKEQNLIKAWIQSGAKYEDHWAFTAPKRPAVPQVADKNWSHQTLDRFALKHLEDQNLTTAKPADPRTLIRRVTFDLTGLPPTRTEIHHFLADVKKSPEIAWENLIDGLLARPQFGEHFARHWLDLVRFADTNGMHKDFYRNHVSYRDWVIRAFNENLPYDQFVKFQLAGDLFEKPTKDQLIASGFHRLHLIIDKGTALPEESHVKNVLDRTSAVGTAFLGMTVQCAQCHDHKFDPISQKEFFSLYAFFNNIDSQPETGFRPPFGLQQPFVRWPTDTESAQLKSIQSELAKLRPEIKNVDVGLKKATAEKKKEVAGNLKKKLAELKQQEKRLNQRNRSILSLVESAMVMKERAKVRPTHVLIRGQYDSPGERVQRATPAFLPPMKRAGQVASRMDLANWFTRPDHPLTARVAVNRFWQSFFGVGLVKTSEDFGNQGEVPSHPELLDELTVGFVNSGWNVKTLIKRIVMSKTYRQQSSSTPDKFKADPENRLLARGSRYRLDAEMIRDQILATSGSLNSDMYGPSVKPPQPDGLWKAVSMTGQRFRADKGNAIYRRSIYTFWKRAMPPPQMTILNAPYRDSCIARRERTNTPTQALLLLNESEYLKAARRLAQLTLKQPKADRLAFVWETVTSKIPDKKEQAILESLLVDMAERYTKESQLTEKICEGVKLETATEKAELAAWTMICSTIYNLDITKTKD